jgi:class 3 adenylate cyclase
MPLYIDVHELAGVTLDSLAEAHNADLRVQSKYDVKYIKYWVNESKGKVFCLCSAPSADAASQVHQESHGMPAHRIIDVDPDLAESFMGDAPVASTGAVLMPHSSRPDPGIRTIVFTDIVGSTAITQELGDHAAMQMVEAHDRVVRAALRRHGGREVKHLGDGIMAAFVTAIEAVKCAAAIQAEMRTTARNRTGRVEIRIGAASGEPVERQGDFFGSTVQLAARLCAVARPVQSVVSASVVELCPHVRFDDIGDVVLKGFPQPVRAHAVVDD